MNEGMPTNDPQRRIAPAPGTELWEALPQGERGVSPQLPVTYGSRQESTGRAQLGPDEVQKRLGPAPVARAVEVREGLESLPSMVRREQKRNRLTLAAYAGVTIACVLGLWLVASNAFGW